MRIPRPVPLEDAEIGILSRNLRCKRTESGTLFHALKDEVNAEALTAFHTEAIGPDVILLLQVFLLHVWVGHWSGMRWLRAKASTQRLYSSVRLRRTSLVMG